MREEHTILGNMRANGVRTLAAWCLGPGHNHFRVLDVSGYADDVPVTALTPSGSPIFCSIHCHDCRRGGRMSEASARVRMSESSVGIYRIWGVDTE